MSTMVDFTNTDKKLIKILIKSVQYGNDYRYYLYFSPTNVGYEILYLSFYTLCEQFRITWFSCTTEAQEELELTRAFCIYANRKMSKLNFVIGNSNECTIELSSLKRQIVSNLKKKIFPEFEYLFIENKEGRIRECSYTNKSRKKTKEHELLTNLRNSIDWNNEVQKIASKQWWHMRYDYVFQQQFRKFKLLNLYRYSLVVYEMVLRKAIDINEFIPILNKDDIFSRSLIEEELFWTNPISLLDKDIYPLELAYMAENSEFIFYLLENGAKSFSQKEGSSTSSMTSDFIKFLFDNATNSKQFECVLDFMDKHKAQIEKETKIIYEENGYSSRQTIRDGGKYIIVSWYNCALRLQNVEYLELLFEKYKKQILGLLNTMNPYTGNWLSMEKESPTIDMDLKINIYIQKNIVPLIKSNQFHHTSYKDYGIWGFDARTGRPIYESDLYV